MRSLLRCLLLTQIGLGLVACSSLKNLGGSGDDSGKMVQASETEVNSKKVTKKEADGLKGKLQSHAFKGDVAARSMQKWKGNAVSGTFEGKLFKANNAYSMDKSFHTEDNKSSSRSFLGGGKTFKTDNFAGGDQAFKDAKKAFKDGDSKSKWGEKSFATKDNSMGGKMDKDNNKMFGGRDAVFATRNNAITGNAMDHLKKPQTMGNYQTMSEDDVRRFLNKN